MNLKKKNGKMKIVFKIRKERNCKAKKGIVTRRSIRKGIIRKRIVTRRLVYEPMRLKVSVFFTKERKFLDFLLVCFILFKEIL